MQVSQHKGGCSKHGGFYAEGWGTPRAQSGLEVSKCFRRGIASKSNQKVLLNLRIQAVLTHKKWKTEAPLGYSPQQLQRFAFPRKVYEFPVSPRSPRHTPSFLVLTIAILTGRKGHPTVVLSRISLTMSAVGIFSYPCWLFVCLLWRN